MRIDTTMPTALLVIALLFMGHPSAHARPHQQSETISDLDTFIDFYQPYLGSISFYRPTYFLVGVDPKNSKFQLSFKYRFIPPEKPIAQMQPWVTGIYFGYTQTSFWNLAADSAPFKDTSYKPELFFRSRNLVPGSARIAGGFLQAGIQHESNGRDGDASRSTNYAYLEPSLVILNSLSEPLRGLKISPRFWFYFKNNDQTNPDIADYQGYCELGIKFGQADSILVDSRFRWSGAGGSLHMDLTYPLHELSRGYLNLYLQVSYVNALAERFVDYDKRIQAVRVGLSIVR